MATLDTKDSRSTLVEGEEAERAKSGTPHPLTNSSSTPTQEPALPFSASFNPNAPTPLTPPAGIVTPMTTMLRSTPGRANSDAWTNSISISLSALATQFSAASQALAAISAIPVSSDVTQEAIAAIQQAQSKLGQELDSLKEQVSYLLEHGRPSNKEKERAHDVESSEGFESRLQEIEQRLEQVSEAITLDQARMYARLRNSAITSNKMLITPLAMTNGKTPQNFPATKGEFEHLTKERYEHLLKSYGLPVKGDTAAKRQAVREFIGLTPAA
ncbi:hypothetical protein BDY19DRAFT_907366 [Irpex rosettiformis]|uniref:Uncharacterized protein n=1 Tax=Irpex rosettiformis TaxID=378272 RepID=A0ACB8TZS2_9APHY|nr:hypothetical protein BDY19DRAFT_907366 [Irpex rosettiformis]